MSKKSKQKRNKTEQDVFDKPEYAMDIVVDKPKKAPKEKPKEEAFHVGESIGDKVATKLTELKAQLEEMAAAVKEAPAKAKRRAKTSRTAKERLEDNPDLSFAELFDPEDDEEVSFDELLKDSKLDWHHFKDE
ncbi:hypothetical protein [Alicyclobacillus suci]|uniref:hypothetical protein n=1 Tax=Alicyclobacillus suci TaxID=2816080 RepID=UPI001A8CD460|nr:hypothetical protein [Alicyclobacillus suci]